jgi:hypothetical protein
MNCHLLIYSVTFPSIFFLIKANMKGNNTSYLSGEANSLLPSMLQSINIEKKEDIESRPRIEIIEEIDQDSVPPSLDLKIPCSKSFSLKQDRGNEVSLMEQMMKEALETKVVLDKEKESQRKKDIQSSSFGLKKGFLNRKTKSAKKRDIVVVPSKIKGCRQHSLQIPEVQEAMSASSSNLLRRTIQNEFTSPDLLNRIQQNPKLIRGMNDTQCMAALDALQKNPKAAIEKFRDYPNVLEFINEMLSLLGDHFLELNETKDSDDDDKKSMEKKITYLEKEEDKLSRSVRDVIRDKELTSLLMDQDIQRVMHECSTAPILTRKYMSDPVYGPKLKRLMDAGLLQLVQ